MVAHGWGLTAQSLVPTVIKEGGNLNTTLCSGLTPLSPIGFFKEIHPLVVPTSLVVGKSLHVECLLTCTQIISVGQVRPLSSHLLFVKGLVIFHSALSSSSQIILYLKLDTVF